MRVQKLSGPDLDLDFLSASKEDVKRKNKVGEQLDLKKNQQLSFESSSISSAVDQNNNANQEPEKQLELQISQHEQSRNNLFKDFSSSQPPDYEEALKKKTFWEKCCGCFKKN